MTDNRVFMQIGTNTWQIVPTNSTQIHKIHSYEEALTSNGDPVLVGPKLVVNRKNYSCENVKTI